MSQFSFPIPYTLYIKVIQDQLKYIVWLVVLLLLQVLLFGHIHVLGYATPMVYVLFAANMRRGTGRVTAMLWCFAMGLAVDVFMLTPGLAAASMTAIGFIQPPLMQLMTPKDTADDCVPTYKSMGTSRYIQYIVILLLAHNVFFFAIEACTMAHLMDSLLRMACSTALTLALILPIAKISQ